MQNREFAFNNADNSITASRLCFPARLNESFGQAFALKLIKGMAEILAAVGL